MSFKAELQSQDRAQQQGSSSSLLARFAATKLWCLHRQVTLGAASKDSIVQKQPMWLNISSSTANSSATPAWIEEARLVTVRLPPSYETVVSGTVFVTLIFPPCSMWTWVPLGPGTVVFVSWKRTKRNTMYTTYLSMADKSGEVRLQVSSNKSSFLPAQSNL